MAEGTGSATRDEYDLQGNLARTSITDILQFVSLSGISGELSVTGGSSDRIARVYISHGSVIHCVCGNLVGLDGLVDMLGWVEGEFRFLPDVLPPHKSLDMTISHALMEAVRLRDERDKYNSEQRRNEMPQEHRASTDIMDDLLRVPGVDAVVVVGRDGFAIDSAGRSTKVSIDDLGAALAHTVNGIEEMGSELEISKFQDFFIEYGMAVILCQPVGDAIAAIIAPDSSKLGIIRHKAKKLMAELAEIF